jgi:hypothetical protein
MSEPPMMLSAPLAGGAVQTPEQLDADAASRTEFQGLGREAAVALAVKDFHIDRPSWTSPIDRPSWTSPLSITWPGTKMYRS